MSEDDVETPWILSWEAVHLTWKLIKGQQLMLEPNVLTATSVPLCRIIWAAVMCSVITV